MFRNNLIAISKLMQSCSITGPVIPASSVPVRQRWWATRPPVLRQFGYEDKVAVRGTLPRFPDLKQRLPMKPYCPKNSWAEKRAMFGQNDYIDILGDGSLHPTQITYNVPYWLRGFKGNEYAMLLRKRKFFGIPLAKVNPEKSNDLTKRIRYLTTVLNRKRRFHYNPRY